jgi:hypothetical protein
MSSIHLRSLHAEPPLTQVGPFEAAARPLSFKPAAAEPGVTPTAISTLWGAALPSQAPSPLALGWAGEQLSAVFRDGFERFARAS